MNHAVIDIGSNSMRLTVYRIEARQFRILCKEKIMAGLAGYVENGCLTDDGIACAREGLLDFKNTLKALGISAVSVFATASLRNIHNTMEAVVALRAATGFPVEVITGEEEALYGYVGAMQELDITDGVFTDIGGASTEVTVLANGTPGATASFPLGSLGLYRECVKKILPGRGSISRIERAIRKETAHFPFPAQPLPTPLVCVGGTARAVLKIARRLFDLPASCRRVTADQLAQLSAILCAADKAAADLILRLAPERIHTMVPGLLILRYLAEQFHVSGIVVSQYGVREGYVCQKLLTGH